MIFFLVYTIIICARPTLDYTLRGTFDCIRCDKFGTAIVGTVFARSDASKFVRYFELLYQLLFDGKEYIFYVGRL